MLTGKQIANSVTNGSIIISDFDESRLNPNSYNLRLDNKIRYYPQNLILDPMDKFANDMMLKDLKPEGAPHDDEECYLLKPNTLYLAQTMEYTETKKYIPCISGRSSIGRLGINVHVTAGFGDIGFGGTWTLELFVINPIYVYPGMEIAQIYFFDPIQDYELGDYILYNGKYQGQNVPTSSRIYDDMANVRKEMMENDEQ